MPYVSKETIEKIENVDLLQTVSDYTDLKKEGSQYKGLSPFNNEKTPSFFVNPDKNLWKDFSSEKGGKSPIGFIMEKEGFSFIEAIEYLSSKFSIPIIYEDSLDTKSHLETKEKELKYSIIYESIISALENEFHLLSNSHPAKKEIYQRRRYTEETVHQYRIGYAPGYKFIYDLCKKNSWLNEAEHLGLIDKEKNRDKWINRIIYPLTRNSSKGCQIIGLSGRRVSSNDDYPKWINSKSSDLYKKDEFLYGFDKARNGIQQTGEAWIVEGYNDVITWQSYGLKNTVGLCGTSLSEFQTSLLRKYCEKIILCLDHDKAGIEAMLKYIPKLIQKGFRVQMLNLGLELDPDEFVRYWSTGRSIPNLSELHVLKEFREDGFEFLMKERFKGKDKIEIAREVRNLSYMIAGVEDKPMQNIYAGWLSKESGSGKNDIKKYIKEKLENLQLEPPNKTTEYYEIPSTVNIPLEDLIPTIETFQMFIAHNRIWIQDKKGPPFTFKPVSNFSIDIIQHMNDEKFPSKLIKLVNVHKSERIFDVPSNEINSLQSFENMITAHGNYRWTGNKNDLEILKTYLFDKMGVGRKIEVLGWQPEGFWAWNNKIKVPSGNYVQINKNGVFQYQDESFYIPSANDIYSKNLYKFEAQKKVLSIKNNTSFSIYAKQLIKVHRSHGMTALLFTIASIFQDIVVDELKMFPMLFFFGPPASGKDQLADICQSFFGKPQTAINLESGVSTIKAQVREFAQFSNTISHLSEYKNGDPKLDGVLKGLWDRRGYKRGNIDSHVGTDSIPILSSVLMTGNYAPDQEALITRFIWEFMDKTTFSTSESEEFENLNDMTKEGISSFTDKLLNHRDMVKSNFKIEHRKFKNSLNNFKPNTNSRIISNLAVLGSIYSIFETQLSFPFTRLELIEHFESIIDKQMRKLNSASIINKWWDCFLASTRGSLDDQLRVNRDFKLEGDKFFFNITSCYNKISRQWKSQFQSIPPSKSEISDKLKKDSSWIEYKNSVRFAKGRKSTSTSAFVIDLNQIPIKKDIQSAIEYQDNPNNLYQ